MSSKLLNIVVPMAGRGSRFSKAGYALPKPLLPVHGVPMIMRVIENLRPSRPHQFIFICQEKHLKQNGLHEVLLKSAPGCEIVPLKHVTEGAACTVLLAENFINNDQPLMIANCDQYVSVSIDSYLDRMESGGYDGFIMTMRADDPKWSFVRLDYENKITEVVEKKMVSNEATVGIYNFRHGNCFVDAAKEMIAANDCTNNEFYVAPVYNYMLKKDKSVGFMNIGYERAGMYGLGIPEDLEYFNSLNKLPT